MATKKALQRIARSFSTAPPPVFAQDAENVIPIQVWWDMNSSPVGVSYITPGIHDMFRSVHYNGPINIKAYATAKYFPPWIIRKIEVANGIKINDVPSGLINVMVNDIRQWCADNPPPACHLLVSRCFNFKATLNEMEARGYQTLVAVAPDETLTEYLQLMLHPGSTTTTTTKS